EQHPDKALYESHLATVKSAFDGAMDKAGADGIVVFSGAQHYYFMDDSTYPFRNNPLFLYWLPLVGQTNSYVLYQRDKTPQLFYYQPDDYWHAVAGDPDPYWAEYFDITPIRDFAEAKTALHKQDVRAPILIGEAINAEQSLGIERVNPRAALHYLDIARVTKTDYELEHMREASRLGAIAHRAAESAFRSGDASEYDIHHAYLKAIGFVDNDLPYHSIVGLNENAAVLHYQHRDRRVPTELHSFLIDAGAQSAGYASDITRTYSKSDTGLFAELIDAMDMLQQSLCAQVTEGQHYPELHNVMHDGIAKLLVDSEVAKTNAETLVERGITRALLPHGLGHYLGLQVHDVGGHVLDEVGTPTQRPERDPNLRLTRGLGPNEVVTIEPGLYFIDLLLAPIRESEDKWLLDWRKVDALRPYGGIRIEDNVRVNGQTPENLTRDAFANV
ncbi:MAG: Xaa-Pro dipeptidase, partial [Pseudomonadota bacterium]